jgi:hypothetical protein
LVCLTIVFLITILDKILFFTTHIISRYEEIVQSLGLAWTVMPVQVQHKGHWLKGAILLTTGERTEGKLIYVANAEAVSVKLENGTQKTYSSSQLQSFYFLDFRHELIRHFKKSTLPEENREAVVEVVFEGDLQVLRCLKPKHRRYTKEDFILNLFPTEPYDHGRFQYFVHDGISLRTFENFLQKGFTPKTKRRKKQLENFRYRNQPDNGVESWLRLFFYYNVLENEIKSRPYLPKATDSTQLIVSNYF